MAYTSTLKMEAATASSYTLTCFTKLHSNLISEDHDPHYCATFLNICVYELQQFNSWNCCTMSLGWRMVSSGMSRCVALVRTDVSEERSASFIKYQVVFLRSMRRLLVTGSVVPSSPILVTLMKEALSSSETSVLTRAMWLCFWMAWAVQGRAWTCATWPKKLAAKQSENKCTWASKSVPLCLMR
jgi:hypothetical protein